MSRVLVLAPHPDDEAVGPGGTLRAHALDGDEVRVVFLTSGEAGGHGREPAETAVVREEEARAAAAVLGLAGVEFWRQPDGAARVTRALVDRLRDRLQAFDPDVFYVTHALEFHADHRAAARLARRALDALPVSARRPLTRLYEVWTPLHKIDEIIDISAHVDAKRAAIRAHATQCAALRFDESALALNRFRGEMYSWPGGDYAEVFQRWER